MDIPPGTKSESFENGIPAFPKHSADRSSSNTIVTMIKDLNLSKNRIHPSRLKEDKEANDFLIEGIIMIVFVISRMLMFLRTSHSNFIDSMYPVFYVSRY